MNSPQSKGMIVYVGADVSKDTIDISYHSDVKRISAKIDNETKAIKVFVKKMKVEKGATLHFVFESTGYYSKTLYTTLRDLKIPFSQINPRYSNAFIHSLGVLHKTDKADAQLLEEYGRRMTPASTIPDENLQLELKSLYMLRVALIEEQRMWQQRSHQHTAGAGKQVTKIMLEGINEQIAVLDKKIASLIESRDLLKDIYAEILKINGVGPCAAGAVMCLLPEIGTLSCNKIVKLAGLAPMQRQSGISIHKTAHITGGRKHLRTALYMPTLAATRSNPVIHACHERMKEKLSIKDKKDKNPDKSDDRGKLALVPCMRKLLKHINSVARNARNMMQRTVAAEGHGEAAQASPSE